MTFVCFAALILPNSAYRTVAALFKESFCAQQIQCTPCFCYLRKQRVHIFAARMANSFPHFFTHLRTLLNKFLTTLFELATLFGDFVAVTLHVLVR
jgi:hypothetical protein